MIITIFIFNSYDLSKTVDKLQEVTPTHQHERLVDKNPLNLT